MFFCKKKCVAVNSGKAYAYCLAVGCPELITANWKKLNKLKKKFKKGRQQNLIKTNIKKHGKSNDTRD